MARKKSGGRRAAPRTIRGDALAERLTGWFGEGPRARLHIGLYILALLVLSRLLLLAVYFVHGKWTGDGRGFFDALCIFDAGWYRDLLDQTPMYMLSPKENGEANWAFFPLLPLLFRGLVGATGLDPNLLAFWVNTLLFGGALYLGFRYILRTGGSALHGVLFVTIFTLGPYTFYFSSLYTEALFVLLLFAALYLMKAERYLGMGLCGALLSATRNTGILLVFAVLAEQISRYTRLQPQGSRSFKGFALDVLKRPKLILGVSLIPAGLFAYMAYLQNLMGDGLAFVHVQVAWDRGFVSPLRVLLSGLTGAWGLYYLLWVLLAALGIGFLLYQRRWAEAALSCLLVLLPLTTSLYSIPRYIVGSALPLLGLSGALAQVRRRYRRAAFACVLLAALALSLVLTDQWFNMNPMLA